MSGWAWGEGKWGQMLTFDIDPIGNGGKDIFRSDRLVATDSLLRQDSTILTTENKDAFLPRVAEARAIDLHHFGRPALSRTKTWPLRSILHHAFFVLRSIEQKHNPKIPVSSSNGLLPPPRH